MYTESAALYDVIYSSFKDFAAESRALAELVAKARPGARTVLDVGCGTAEHARRLSEVHGFEVDGIDLDPAFVSIAQAKHPPGRFVQADMVDFHLGRTYDAVVCLFGSIGYVATVPRLRQAMACLREHAAPGGIVIVEPFLTPEAFAPSTGTRTVESEGRRITRTNRSALVGGLCHLHFEYVIEGPEGTQRSAEVHELGLFTVDEMMASFSAEGLAARYEPQGLSGRGLYVASAAA